MTEIRVGVADYAVASGPSTISTFGLGSCIAIVLWDSVALVGGMAHVLLPSEGLSRDAANRAKFPTTAVPLLLEEMQRFGAFGRPIARIVGGASMFGTLLPAGGINMGERNIEATRRALRVADIPLTAEDVGGDHGRSVYFNVADGSVRVSSLKKGDLVL